MEEKYLITTIVRYFGFCFGYKKIWLSVPFMGKLFACALSLNNIYSGA